MQSTIWEIIGLLVTILFENSVYSTSKYDPPLFTIISLRIAEFLRNLEELNLWSDDKRIRLRYIRIIPTCGENCIVISEHLVETRYNIGGLYREDSRGG